MEVILAISAIMGLIKENKGGKEMNLEYKKVEEKDKEKLFELINIVIRRIRK